MQLGLVVGTAISSVKHPSMEGWKLMVVQPLLADGRSADGDPVLVVDSLGAGWGERVILSSDGAETRRLVGSDTSPVRWSAIGICD